ncbi:MAG: hypothetical protein QOD57_1550 [Actinomycetota bacterium]|nr:hypothetical protein [Actinomycetota bacterium]
MAARITDEALAELEESVGVVLKDRPQPHIEQLTPDTIRHFAWGAGDDNPLWLDKEYAAASVHGGILAAPCTLYAADRTVSGYVNGLPGVHALFAGTDWRWHRPLRAGDAISAEPSLKGIEIKPSAFSRRTIKQTFQVRFLDQAQDLVADADSWVFRTERDTAREVGKYAEVPVQTRYDTDQIDEIAAAYRSYRRRGAEPLLWEDVDEGVPLPELLKGPLTVTGMIAWDQGWGGLYIRAHGMAFALFDAHPALAIPNGQGVPDVPERVHWDQELATGIGAPGPYDYGPERITWLSQLVTDFIGDGALLRRLNVQVRRFNVIGDLTRCRGTVTRKYRDGDRHLIECTLGAVNQRDELTAQGLAVAELPSASTGPVLG